MSALYDIIKTSAEKSVVPVRTELPITLSQTKNLGVLTCRFVPDAGGKPLKVLENVRELWVPQYDEGSDSLSDGFFLYQLPDINSWGGEGKDILEKNLEMLHKLEPFFQYGITVRKAIVYFFAKPLEFLKKNNEGSIMGGSLRIFRSYAQDFQVSLMESINQKAKFEGSEDFLNRFISRTPEPTRRLMTIETDKKPESYGYKTTVTFQDEGKTPLALTEEDLKLSQSFDEIGVNVKKFNKEMWERKYHILELYYDALSRNRTETSYKIR